MPAKRKAGRPKKAKRQKGNGLLDTVGNVVSAPYRGLKYVQKKTGIKPSKVLDLASQGTSYVPILSAATAPLKLASKGLSLIGQGPGSSVGRGYKLAYHPVQTQRFLANQYPN